MVRDYDLSRITLLFSQTRHPGHEERTAGWAKLGREGKGGADWRWMTHIWDRGWAEDSLCSRVSQPEEAVRGAPPHTRLITRRLCLFLAPVHASFRGTTSYFKD